VLVLQHGCIEKLDKHSGVARGLAGAMAPYGLQISIENSILIKTFR
jgi:hypothetical protein